MAALQNVGPANRLCILISSAQSLVSSIPTLSSHILLFQEPPPPSWPPYWASGYPTGPSGPSTRTQSVSIPFCLSVGLLATLLSLLPSAFPGRGVFSSVLRPSPLPLSLPLCQPILGGTRGERAKRWVRSCGVRRGGGLLKGPAIGLAE